MTTTMTRPDPLRLLLVDDHPVVREALCGRLEAEPRFKVVGEAGDIRQGIAQIEATNPHLAVIDVSLDKQCGLFLARLVRERHPGMRVLIWSMHANPSYVAAARAAGASGYVLKNGPKGEIVRAIETVADGGCYYSAGVDREAVPRPELTPREKQVLKLVAGGRSSSQIAKQLRIDRRTVESHRFSIMNKLGAKNVVDMVVIAIGIGLLDIHDFVE